MIGEPEAWVVSGNERMSKQRVELELTHLHYAQSEECPAKIELRNRLQDLSEKWLSVQPHHKKFTLDKLPSILARSILQHPNEDVALQEIANALLALSHYTSNILSQPWRKEFKAIKLYGGFYQQEIGSLLSDVDQLMIPMGYELDNLRHLWVFHLPRKQQRDELPRVGLDLFLAAVECQLMSRIWTAVTAREPNISLYNVLQYREQHMSSWESAVRGLLYEARAQSYALSQTALTPMSPVPTMPVMPPVQTVAPLSYGYCMYHPYYNAQLQQQFHSQANRYSLVDNNPHNLDVPPPPPPPQFVPDQSYGQPMQQLNKNYPSSFIANPTQYNSYSDPKFYPAAPPLPLYQPFTYPKAAPSPDYAAPTSAPAPAIPQQLIYDQNAVLIDFSAPQPRYEPIMAQNSPPPPPHQLTQGNHQSNRINYSLQNGRDDDVPDTTLMKPKAVSHHSHTEGDTSKSRTRPKHSKQLSPPHQKNDQRISSPTQALPGDDDHSWEYVFRNLQIQGYNKDLGERGDLLKPVPVVRIGPYPPVVHKSPEHPKPSSSTQDGDHTVLRPPSYYTVKPLKKHSEHKESASKETCHLPNSTALATTPCPCENGWHCHACTYLNEEQKTVCTMCGKSKVPGPEVRTHQPGPQCPQCTLVNPIGRDYCDACGAFLRPTYI